MDNARKIDLLQGQIEEANKGQPSDFDGWRERSLATLRSVFPGDDHWANRFEEVRYTPSMWTVDTPQSYFEKVQRSGVMRAVAVLEGAIHQLRANSKEGAEVDVAGLHPWIQGSVTGLWDVAPPRTAVDEASRAIEIRLKTLLGVDLSGTPLVTQAFNPAPPKPGEKRLRFPGYDEGTQAWTNAHEGAMYFARGCMMRLRNLAEHHDEFDREEALEALAAFSLLARWIESTQIEEGDAAG